MTNSPLTARPVRRRPGPGRSLAMLSLVLLAAYLVARGWLYPFWPDTIGALGHPWTADPGLAGAWGGPTLVGAWAVHAALAVAGQVVCLSVLAALRRPAK